MVSMVETASHPDHNDTVMDPVVPKSEPLPDGSISSTVSTPDAEAEPLTQDTTQTQKRKGGRKPVRYRLLLPPLTHFGFFFFFLFLGSSMQQRIKDAIIRGPAFLDLFPYRFDMLPLAIFLFDRSLLYCCRHVSLPLMFLFGSYHPRFMLPRRNGSSVTDRPRLPSVNVVRSISVS